ncbi:MAG TPA: hypothetical protein VE593_04860, partial [Nitrososphaeraceae archaeon]|nr:hypothetical protein [Nitrososphaeraceae archaeon]
SFFIRVYLVIIRLSCKALGNNSNKGISMFCTSFPLSNAPKPDSEVAATSSLGVEQSKPHIQRQSLIGFIIPYHAHMMIDGPSSL